MAERYLYFEVNTVQVSRNRGDVCGDLVRSERNPASTLIVVCDGLGHGVKANLSATMCVARLMELMRSGASLRKSFLSVARTMEEAKTTGMPYAAFTAVRILNDGEATVLTYDAPAPVFVGPRHAAALPTRAIPMDHLLLHESTCHLAPGEGLLLVSDGITQAGIGKTFRSGWGTDGLVRFATGLLSARGAPATLPKAVLEKAVEHSGGEPGDDCTVTLAMCRAGRVLNILTGPPVDRRQDREVVARFLGLEGTKVVCGGTTSKVVAGVMGVPLEIAHDDQSMVAPPRCRIQGVDLVTEGAVTLNQVYNVLDADPSAFEEDSGVTELCELLRLADRINIIYGTSSNPASGNISFRQRGILQRDRIIPLLADRLRAQGKLVVVETV
jgi:hypothetical protein